MVDLTIDTSNLVNGESFEREEFIDPAEELVVHLENLLNAVQAFEAMLIGAGVIDGDSAVEINSPTKVFAPPRMTGAQRLAIANVLESAMVYDTDSDVLTFYDGLSWASLFADGVGSASTRGVTAVNFSWPNGVAQFVAFGTVTYDTDGMHNLGDNSKITINTAGKYSVSAVISLTTTGTGSLLVEIVLNASTVIASARVKNSVYPPRVTVSTTYDFAATDFIRVRVTQNSGASKTLPLTVCSFSAHLQLAPNQVALLDSFGTPTAGPLSSPFSADGTGTWVFVQNDGQFSIT